MMRQDRSIDNRRESASQSRRNRRLRLEQLLPRDLLDVRCLCFRNFKFGKQQFGVLGGLLSRGKLQGRAALDGGSVKESFCGWHRKRSEERRVGKECR